MKPNLDQIQRRTVGYWFNDGLVDLFVGGIFLLLSLFFLVSGLLQPGFLTALTVGIGQPLIILVGFLVGKKVVPLLKEKYVYPRTGFVAYKERSTVSRGGRAVIAMLVGALTSVAVMLILPSFGENSIWFISGIMIAVFIVYLSFRSGLIRYLILASVAILCGSIVSVLGVADTFRSAVFYGLFGLAWLVQGGVSLVGYFRKHTLTGEEVE
jgi:hypothetical protein